MRLPPPPMLVRLAPHAIRPSYGSQDAIGLDIFPIQRPCFPTPGWQNITAQIVPGQVAKIHTGVQVAIPRGWYGRLAPKSGLAATYGVQILAGVIDPDYRGELVVLATSVQPCLIKLGKAVCQLIIERADNVVVREVGELSITERGDGGFGSTGR